MLDESSSLFKALQSVENLGRDVDHEVKLGDFLFTLRPIGSGDETTSYIWAEKMSQPDLPEGVSPPPFQVTPAYVIYVKQHVVSQSIYAISGVVVDRGDMVMDVTGKPQEVGDYVLRLVQSWPSEVIDFMFMEYNKLQIKVGEKYGFTLAHREAMNALDKLIKLGADLQEKIKGQAAGIREDAVAAEDDVVEDVVEPEAPAPEPEDRPNTGALDQG